MPFSTKMPGLTPLWNLTSKECEQVGAEKFQPAIAHLKNQNDINDLGATLAVVR
jgi:hypothetical protein